MAQEFDMTVDVDWGGTKEERTGNVPPEVGEQEFEITKVFGGIQKTGDNVGAPYTNLLCTQMSGEFPGTRSTFKFCGFGKLVGKRGTTQVGETKAFIVDIGRSDLFENAGFNAQDLIGTQFTATVAHSTNPKDGRLSCWLNNPKPLSAYEDTPTPVAQAAQPVAQPLPPATQAAMVTLGQNAPAPAVEPQPAAPRRMRPTARG
jgi:hypothetical protein